MKTNFSRKHLITFILICLSSISLLGQNSTINGSLYHDLNGNCVKDPNENGLANRLITLSPGPQYTFSQADGSYSFAVDAGGVYSISIETGESAYDYWEASCTGNNIFVAVTPNQDSFNQNMAFTQTLECPVLEVQASMNPLVSCQSNVLILSYENTGTATAQNAIIQFSLDNNLNLIENTAEISGIPDYTEYEGIPPLDTVDIDMTPSTDPLAPPTPNTSDFEVSLQNSISLGDISVGGSGQVFVDLMVNCNVDENYTAYIQTNIIHNESNLPYCGTLETTASNTAEIFANATCTGDSIEFTIVNLGGDMDSIATIGIYEDNLMGYLQDYYLFSEEFTRFSLPADGTTYTLIGGYSDYSPVNNHPIISVEGCGFNEEGPSTGYVTSFPHNDYVPFKDILCLEIQEVAPTNQKTVHPSGITEANYVHSKEKLTYTINFQNTQSGPSPLSITDVLSSSLDINTLQIHNSTHPFSFSILDNQTLQWDILDSLESEESGHVVFGIEIIEGTPDFTEISNHANLTFGDEVFLSNNTMLTVCDDCIFPQEPHTAELKVFLEGPYNNNGTMDTYLGALIPLDQPFNTAPYHHYGTEQLDNIPSEMVDWVLVEARYGELSFSNQRRSLTAETKAAILFSDGTIRSLDGSLGLVFDNLVEGNDYHFCIRHRNHLDVVSSVPSPVSDLIIFDFTDEVDKAHGFSQMKNTLDGKAVLYGAEFNADGVIQATDYDAWTFLPAATNIYENTDANLDGVIQATDYDVWFLNKAKVGSVEIRF